MTFEYEYMGIRPIYYITEFLIAMFNTLIINLYEPTHII